MFIFKRGERAWDAQIEADAEAGKLDALEEEALAEHRAGKKEAVW